MTVIEGKTGGLIGAMIVIYSYKMPFKKQCFSEKLPSCLLLHPVLDSLEHLDGPAKPHKRTMMHSETVSDIIFQLRYLQSMDSNHKPNSLSYQTFEEELKKEKTDGIDFSALTKYQSYFRPPCAVKMVRTHEQAEGVQIRR